ncbi:hypothetical protein RI054_09g46920 [Pseudoscourfieldia marina]
MQTKQQIRDNANLKKISLPSLTTTNIVFEVVGNPKLKKLCANKLKNGGRVCIGNDQPDLDADLSELVTGSFLGLDVCYQDSDASTVCGPDGGLGLFSSPSNRCPSNACMMHADE